MKADHAKMHELKKQPQAAKCNLEQSRDRRPVVFFIVADLAAGAAIPSAWKMVAVPTDHEGRMSGRCSVACAWRSRHPSRWA